MFKQILDALTTKYKGVDARILTRMARKLAKSVKSEDEVQDAVDGVTMMDFIQQESDRSAQAATKNAVNDYEQKYHIKDGKPFKAAEPTPPADGDGDGDDDDDEGDGGTPTPTPSKNGRARKHVSKLEAQIAALTETVSTLTGTIKGMQQERTAKTRRQQYEELFEGVDEKVKNRYLRNFERLSFKDDNDFNEWLEEMTTQVTEELKALPNGGAAETPAAGGNGAGGNAPAGGVQPQHRGATPPLGGSRSANKGLSPEFQRYMARQKQHMAGTVYSTIAGVPQMQQNPAFAAPQPQTGAGQTPAAAGMTQQ